MSQQPLCLIWTYTLLDAYENCNYKGFRKYLALGDERVPYVGSPAQAWGNTVHTAFEKRISHGEPLPDKLFEWEARVQTMLPYRPAVELKLGITADRKPVGFHSCEDGCGRGKLDFVTMHHQTALILDWKTNAKPREDPRELAIQALLLKAKYPHLTKILAHYVWVTHDKLGRVHDVSDTDATWRRVQGMVADIRRKWAANYWPKNENPLCPWCEVPTNDCEFRRPIPNK